MAITVAAAGTPFTSTSNVASYATASWTPTANRLILVAVSNSDATATTAPALSGNSLTWDQILTQQRADLVKQITFFRAYNVSGGTAGALTATFAAGVDNQTGCQIHIIEVAGAAGSGDNGASAIVQSVGATFTAGPTPTITLAAFADATNNAGVGGFEWNADPAVTDYTQISETTYASPTSWLLTQYKVGQDTAFDITVAGSGVGIAIEVAIAPVVAAFMPYRNRMPPLIAQ